MELFEVSRQKFDFTFIYNPVIRKSLIKNDIAKNCRKA